MTSKEYQEWLKERDEAVVSLDIDKFTKFYEKWKAKGVYKLPLPTKEVTEIALYKMACNIPEMPTAIKIKALNWLKNRGYDTKL